MARFVVRRSSEADYRDPGPLAPGATGLTRWRAVGEEDGAAHTDFGLSRLEPGGRTATHVHSFEESFHVVRGEVVLATPEATVHLVAGDYGVIPIGVPRMSRRTACVAPGITRSSDWITRLASPCKVRPSMRRAAAPPAW